MSHVRKPTAAVPSVSCPRGPCAVLVVPLLAFLLGSIPPSVRAADEPSPLVPEDHFPKRSIVYCELDDAGELVERLSETLLGRMVVHPGTRAACRDLWEALETRSAPLVERVRSATGRTPAEIAELLHGNTAFTLRTFVPPTLIEAALAVEIEPQSEEWLALLERLAGLWGEASGQAVETREVGEIEARVWAFPFAVVYEAVIGTHVVFTTTPDILRDIHAAHAGARREGGGLSENPAVRELADALDVPNRQFRLVVDLEAVRGLVFPLIAVGGPRTEDVRRILRLTGVTRLTAFGKALGFRDGVPHVAVQLGMREGSSGILDVLQSGLRPVPEPEGVLERIPARAERVSALRVAPGSILRGIDRLVREAVPEFGPKLDEAFRRFETETGISVEDDLFGLGDVTLWTFTVRPPAGGLFPDVLCLVRTDELAPYLSLAKKVGERVGHRELRLESGDGEVTVLEVGGLRNGRPLVLEKLLRGREPTRFEAASLAILAALQLSTLSRQDLDDGWTLLSGIPQPILRGPLPETHEVSLAADPLGELAAKRLSGATCASVRRGGGVLAVYNTVLFISGCFAPLLRGVGVDVARLPPGEAFLEYDRPGSVRFEAEPHGFGLRLRDNLAIAPLSAIGVGAFAAGLVVPSLARARARAEDLRRARREAGREELSLPPAEARPHPRRERKPREEREPRR